jgi:hypothetical protein
MKITLNKNLNTESSYGTDDRIGLSIATQKAVMDEGHVGRL